MVVRVVRVRLIDVIFMNRTFEARVGCSQSSHEEAMLVDAVRMEVHEAVERREARMRINGMVFLVQAVHQTLKHAIEFETVLPAIAPGE